MYVYNETEPDSVPYLEMYSVSTYTPILSLPLMHVLGGGLSDDGLGVPEYRADLVEKLPCLAEEQRRRILRQLLV